MPEFYLFIVILLFTLAASDLVVGVSNDAVNFLNSAIGSKVAPRRIIMIVASLGILVGATFSSGMMEVARKGIFNPEFFVFSEIMVIFLAVMLTDIILLDMFNTFGMPTSTTVSIVFELLGAAVAVSILKILGQGDSISTLGEYINTSSAVLIISGIFLSVVFAFLIGSLVQFVSRLLFSFNLDRRMKWVGAWWSGLAFSALTYFLLIKGIKGASFVSSDFILWVQENTVLLIGISFVFWTAVMTICLNFFRLNILRYVVLFGTFTLAMAFASNDLVNFIGVPIAGFESFRAWSATNADPGMYAMSILNEPVRTETYLLVIAGAIMITTLWFSKKARSVTETEVNLGRQDEGAERFSPNALSKGIVRATITVSNGINSIIPDSWINKAEDNFEPLKESIPEEGEYDPPAFDLVRASVNLTVASILIAFATSLKLPLSTTYVSFMVAMGTSLSDRAWGRSSAVFRVAGVINVIGGWFFTAFIAFTVSAIFATLIFHFKLWAILALLALAIYLISRTFIFHKKKEKDKAKFIAVQKATRRIPANQIVAETSDKVYDTLSAIRLAYRNAITGLLSEDRRMLKTADRDISVLQKENETLKRQLYGLIKRIKEDDAEASRVYLLVYDLLQDIIQSTSLIVQSSRDYIENSLPPIDGRQEKELRTTMYAVDEYMHQILEMTRQQDFHDLNGILDMKSRIFEQLEHRLTYQVKGIKGDHFGMRNSLLVFSIALETKDLVAVAARFIKLYHRYNNGH